MHPDNSTPSHLPAPLPSPAALLRRTQAALGLLREVVQESSAEYWYEQGKQATFSQDLTKAVRCFEQAIKINSNSWKNLLQLAAALAAHQAKGAAPALIKAYDFGPYTAFEKFKPELTAKQWALIEANMNEPDEFDRFIALSILHQLSRDEDAMCDVLGAIDYKHKLSGEKSFVYSRLLGWYSNYVGDNFGALQFYARAVRLEPNRPEGYFHRSGLRFQGQDYSGSLADANRAIELDSGNSMLYANRGAIKASTRDIAGALTDFNRSLELNPNNFFGCLNRARIKYDTKDYRGSIADFNQAVSISPQNVEAYFRRGLCKEQLNDFTGALADYDFASGLNSTSPDIFNQRASLKERMGDWNGAEMDRYLARTFKTLHG